MSGYKNPNFVKEFAYRTKVNYYLLKQHISSPNLAYSQPLEKVIQDMESNGFDTSMKYEVTLMINSMIGLLILPEQAYFDDNRNVLDYSRLSVLKKYVDDTDNYSNTYREKFMNEDMPLSIIRHMRNAISHDNIMIIPESARYGNITHIRFRDAAFSHTDNDHLRAFEKKKGYSLDYLINQAKRNHKNVYEFSLRIKVEDLEELLMEIADFLINS